ncbi:MAG: radical SAM protein [Acidobacteria bacterium]|nr:radical SAM protein [Acidobacteriota bacterium]
MARSPRLREAVARRLRGVPFFTSALARYRRGSYARRINAFLERRDGHAGRLPMGVVYEATMRCNLHCEFCYVGTLLNIEGEWRQELPLDALERAFPDRDGLQVSLTGGEIFMRKDILQVMDVFRQKGYVCGYLTTNGTIITPERARALADLAHAGFLKHISVSIDGPNELHDRARGVNGTFARTAEGLRRLQTAARETGAPLRVSVNTTVAHETLDALHEMVGVAEELGVDAIGLNHLMYSTPEEVDETVRLLGIGDPSVISTFVTRDTGLDPERVRTQVARLASECHRRGIRFDMRPKVRGDLVTPYYTPGEALEGRCLYPFLYARVSFSGKAYFCPFIRVEVGDLTTQSLEEVWTGPRYVSMRRTLVENGIFPVCRRCCKVELAPRPAATAPVDEPLAAVDAS